MFFFLGGWRTRHRARSAAMGCGGGEGKGGGLVCAFCSRGFFFVVLVSRLVDARERGRRGCGTGSAASWGAEWACMGKERSLEGTLVFFSLALCFSLLFRCSSMSSNAHRIPSWRTEETACIGIAAYTKAITHGLLQTGNAQKPPLEVSSTRLVPPFTPHLPNTTMPYYNAGTRVIPSSCPEVSSRPATCCNPGTGKPPPRNMDGGPGWAVEPGRTAGVALSGVRRGAEMCVTYMSVLVRRRHHMWADGFGSLRGSHEGMTSPRAR